MSFHPAPLAVLALLSLAACGDASPTTEARAAPTAPRPVLPAPPVLAPAQIDTAVWTPLPVDAATQSPTIVRAQVLLDRARFSPGIIDGVQGENLRQAVAAYETSRGLPVDGLLDEQVFAALTSLDAAPALTDYFITPEDVAGPFIASVPTDLADLGQLKALSFVGPLELLGEKFHMTEELIQQLNPGVDFSRAGTRITVAAVREQALPAAVARIDVDKTERAVMAYDAAGKLLAFYPATIGSEDRPAPSGAMKVRAVAPNPTYTYDPKRLTYGDGKKKVTVPAGPNSPVGTVWIDLTKDTFGIHGSDEPRQIGKKFSHGCVRLTNWDAEQLASGVKPGVVVNFIG